MKLRPTRLDGVELEYNWNTGASTEFLTVTSAGNYSLVISNACGQASDQVIVTYAPCMIAVPTAFTPNSDGLNDKFGPAGLESIPWHQFKIYNNWGELIFQSSQSNPKWDGTFHGKRQLVGVYVWTLEYKTLETSSIQRLKGTVTLIR